MGLRSTSALREFYLAPVVTDFLQRFSDVSVELLMNDRLVDLLEGEFDVGVRIGRLRDSSLIARKIALIRGFARRPTISEQK